jgi:diguanylate cyclase (GGDEF)-like protein
MTVEADAEPTGHGAARSTKRSLLALSHAMERSLEIGRQEGHGGSGLIIGLFQRRHYFEVERFRYGRLATEGNVCIVGFAGAADDVPPGVEAVSLDEDDALAGEWSLVVLDGSLGTSLRALDLDDVAEGSDTLEAGRLFDARWSFNPSEARAEAERILDVLQSRLDPEVTRRAREVIAAGRSVDLSLTERRLAAVTEVLVHSIDAAYHRAERMESVARREQRLAERDPFTGLGNRRFLERYLASCRRESPMHVGALLIDLDGLKGINDSHGHAAGDAAIMAVARVLRETTRPQDVLIRIGGDEFLVLLPGTMEEGSLIVADRIVQRLGETTLPDPWPEVRLGASVGVLAARACDIDLDDLDAALYRAKREGKGRVALASP